MFDLAALLNEVRSFFQDCRDYMSLQVTQRKESNKKQQDFIDSMTPILNQLSNAINSDSNPLPPENMSNSVTDQIQFIETAPIAALTTQQIEPAITTAPPVGFIASVETEVAKVDQMVHGIFKGFFK